MSGYLRRLAASVSSPARAIHPMPGSIFARPKFDDLPLVHQEESIAPRNAMQAQPDVEAQSPLRRLNQQILVPKSEPTAARSEPNSAAEPTRSDANLERTDTLGVREMVSQTAEPAGNKSMAQVPSQSENKPAPLQTVQQPLLVKSTSRVPVSQRVSFEFPYTPSTIRIEKPSHKQPNASGRSERPEPNDVQIHIGRIEVIAVPPPVSRSQPKPERKSPSLDEYLKRGRC